MIWFHVRSRIVLRLFYEQTAQNKRCSTCSAFSLRGVRALGSTHPGLFVDGTPWEHRTRGTHGTKPVVKNLPCSTSYERDSSEEFVGQSWLGQLGK
jgi:hypothetical protein